MPDDEIAGKGEPKPVESTRCNVPARGFNERESLIATAGKKYRRKRIY